jgi:hypothetical protein
VRLALQARPWPKPRQNTDYFCRRSASDFFFVLTRSFLCVIRAEAALANASTGIGLLQPGMEHRIKSVVMFQRLS